MFTCWLYRRALLIDWLSGSTYYKDFPFVFNIAYLIFTALTRAIHIIE